MQFEQVEQDKCKDTEERAKKILVSILPTSRFCSLDSSSIQVVQLTSSKAGHLATTLPGQCPTDSLRRLFSVKKKKSLRMSNGKATMQPGQNVQGKQNFRL